MISIRLAATGVGLSLMLIACGGGGGAPAVVKSTLTGVAIDGYLENATAFLDLNDNGLLDNNEPRYTTDALGQFTLEATDAEFQKHRVVVLVTTDSIDSDTGEVDSAFKLMAPKGEGGVVSPLTTLVAAHMDSGLTRQDAATKVQTDLGLGQFDVMKNFVGSEHAPAQTMAVALTEVLKTISSDSLSQQLQDTLLSVENKIKPNKEEILAFAESKDWVRLQDKAKLLANPKIDVDLNQKWADFLLADQSLDVKGALLNGQTNDLVKGAQFKIARNDEVITLSITSLGLTIERILTLNMDNQLVSVNSQFGGVTESINFDVNKLPSLPSLPDSPSVKAGDKGIYFEGIFTNSTDLNILCAESSAAYKIETIPNSTKSLKFTLTLNQLDRKAVSGCINPLFSPTPENYEFTLTSDGLTLNAVEATLKDLGTLRLNF